MCFLHFPSLCACPMQETVIPAPKAREEQVIPQELRRTPHRFTMFRASPQPLQSFFLPVGFDGRRNVPTAKSLDADVGSAELPDLFDSLIIAPAATPKLDMDLSEGRWSRLLLGTFGIRDIR